MWAADSNCIGAVVCNGNSRQLPIVLRLRFPQRRFSRPEEIVRLFIIAFVGLGLNTTVVLLLAKILLFDPTLAKIWPSFPCSHGTTSADAQWCSTVARLPLWLCS